MAKKQKVPAPARWVDDLLIATVVCVALVVCAYLYMPDFQRGIQTLVREGARSLSEFSP